MIFSGKQKRVDRELKLNNTIFYCITGVLQLLLFFTVMSCCMSWGLGCIAEGDMNLLYRYSEETIPTDITIIAENATKEQMYEETLTVGSDSVNPVAEGIRMNLPYGTYHVHIEDQDGKKIDGLPDKMSVGVFAESTQFILCHQAGSLVLTETDKDISVVLHIMLYSLGMVIMAEGIVLFMLRLLESCSEESRMNNLKRERNGNGT